MKKFHQINFLKPIEKYLQDNELDFEPGTKAYKDFMKQFGC